MTPSDTEFISIMGAPGNPDEPSRISSRSLPETLPILGLSDIVIFPGAVAPLLVETGPSIQLIDEAVAGDRLIGTLLQKRPEVPDPAPEDLYARRLRGATGQDGEVSGQHRPGARRGAVAD
jgi:ATP-dependent Lon protease